MSYAPPPPQQQAKPQMEHQREPCPDRILDDIGGAFAMGCVGGGAWHLIKGLKNSPSGYRITGALQNIRREAPRLGGSFANWGLSFSVFDCTLMYLRKKEDPWNAIGAGALTGGMLQLRFGLKSAAKSAAFGGFLLALIEGLGIALNKMTAPPPPGLPYQPPQGMAPAPAGPPQPLSSGGEGFPAATAGASFSVPEPSAGTSSSLSSSDSSSGSAKSSGGWFSWGGGAESKPKPIQIQDLSEDPYAAPAMPTEFQNEKYK